jgi:predicted amidophosphoribosyltransferase
MTIELIGNWRKGLAYDVHTLASTYLGENAAGYAQWDNTRSEMGELVYNLKYRQDRTSLSKIVSLLDKIKGIENFDVLIPIPPSDRSRTFQPVTEIALALGTHRSVKVLPDFLAKIAGSQIKNVAEPSERVRVLKETMFINGTENLNGKSVLLIDDLYRSGSTLAVATELLLCSAQAKDVCAVTMTKTRSTR